MRALIVCASLVFLVAAGRRTPVVDVVQNVSSAVVSVRTQVMVSERYVDPFAWFFRDFGSRSAPRQQQTTSQGSGVIIDPRGYVLTNYHVVETGGDIEIELSDEKTLSAEVVGTAPDHDLAVLQVKSSAKLPFIPMGSSQDIMIGETVIAIGNPFGLSHTVTTGVVSALHRSIQTEDRVYSDFIQTDASINPGNSGGPLLNMDGQLIGVNTAIYGKAQGIGFAIPIDKARRIVADLLRFGEVRRPYFGFVAQALTGELAQSFGLRDTRGAVVSDVDTRGPARERLREGDVITSLNGHKIVDNVELRVRLGDATVGESVKLGLLRDNRRQEVDLIATEFDASDVLKLAKSRIGLEVKELDNKEAKRLRLPGGTIWIENVSAGSPAGRVGLRRGDWIRAVNSEKVAGTNAFAKALARAYWRGEVILLIQRGSLWQQVAFEF